MTWIDWATVACVVYAALLSTLVAIRQQQRVMADWERRNYQHPLQATLDCLAELDRFKPDLPVPTAAPRIQAGDPVYVAATRASAANAWDGRLPCGTSPRHKAAAARLATSLTPLIHGGTGGAKMKETNR